jgi:hypothetical protein
VTGRESHSILEGIGEKDARSFVQDRGRARAIVMASAAVYVIYAQWSDG